MYPYLVTRAGSKLKLDFDDKDVEFFIVGINASQGKVAGKFYGEMKYKERYHIPRGGYVYNYYESERAEDNFNLTVID
ncbi:hypothetical protein G3A45_06235 [Caloranaerobacter azorensis]|uniref:Uncharacterized protein n=1 Tax=Caloranaerobacter azorensis TaxID=116090 RepID=A0A6P1YFN9_9FIRM|nr:hypothetical protein G3A45_06235 [Caloranaerobacter azorensis]